LNEDESEGAQVVLLLPLPHFCFQICPSAFGRRAGLGGIMQTLGFIAGFMIAAFVVVWLAYVCHGETFWPVDSLWDYLDDWLNWRKR
jgi:hypothetical protein